MATTSPEVQDQRLQAIAKGREATALAGMLHPYIHDRINQLVHRLAAEYRKGTAEFPVLLGTAAQITCLMDLLSDLDSRARRGDLAMQKEMQDAQETR